MQFDYIHKRYQYERMLDKILNIYVTCNVTEFPIDCFSIIKTCGHQIHTYSELRENNPRLYEICRKFSDDAFRYDNMICYNDRAYPARIRFTLMHELGHIVLNHTDETLEREDEADLFASHILAPRIVMFGLRLADCVDHIKENFDLSVAASSNVFSDYKKWRGGISFHSFSDAEKAIRDRFCTECVTTVPAEEDSYIKPSQLSLRSADGGIRFTRPDPYDPNPDASSLAMQIMAERQRSRAAQRRRKS